MNSAIFLVFEFLVLVQLNKESHCQQQMITLAPQNSSVLIGKDVTLFCTVGNQQGEVTWCKETFCTFGRNRNITNTRLSLIGDATKGEHNLMIKSANLSDEANYQCQAATSEKSTAVKSSFVYLTVLIKPNLVRMVPSLKTDNDSVKLVMKQNSNIECISEDSNPPVDFKWYLDNELLTQGGDVVEISKKADKQTNKLFKTTGKLVVKVDNDLKWNRKTVKCEAHSEATIQLNIEMTDKKTVIVHYAPISAIVKMTSAELVEEEIVEFECAADARPPITNFKWYIDSKVYSNGPNEKFLPLRIENSMHKKLLKCDSTNEVSTHTTSLLLDINYKPKFSKPLPSHKLIGLNEKLILNCEVDSNPPASVFWKLNGTLVYAYPNFTIDSTTVNDYGLYTCEASLKNFPTISTSIKVVQPGPPIIGAEMIQYAFIGYEAAIDAYTEAEPGPDAVLWFKDKNVIKEGSKFKFGSTVVLSKGLKHTLHINAVEQEDFTNYTFFAKNKYGDSRLQIQLNPKANTFEHNSILISTISIIFLVFLTVSVCILFRLCKSKDRRKKRLNQKIRMQRHFMNQNYRPFYTNIDRRNSYEEFDMQRAYPASFVAAAEPQYEVIHSRKQTPDYYLDEENSYKRASRYQTDV